MTTTRPVKVEDIAGRVTLADGTTREAVRTQGGLVEYVTDAAPGRWAWRKATAKQAATFTPDATPTPEAPVSVSPLDYPAMDGRTVTEAHNRHCAEIGHAGWTVGDLEERRPQGTCPRCGVVTETTQQADARRLAAHQAAPTCNESVDMELDGGETADALCIAPAGHAGFHQWADPATVDMLRRVAAVPSPITAPPAVDGLTCAPSPSDG